MYSVDNVDYIQYHMLNMIAGIMHGYNLNPAQVQAQYEYMSSIDPQKTTKKYDSEVWSQPFVSLSDISESETSQQSESDQQSETTESEGPLYVETRREFCLALGSGKKICPSYSSCVDPSCSYFHIRSEFICPHVSRGSSFCEEEGCELIVIKACRKGKRCNEPSCSFRH